MKKIFAIILIFTSMVIGGCASKTAQDVVNATTGLGAVNVKLKADKDLAKIQCLELCRQEITKGTDLSSGPCLGNPMAGYKDWVCDVAHNPRQKVDNDSANQCSAFANGQAKHFIEVDPECNFIKSY